MSDTQFGIVRTLKGKIKESTKTVSSAQTSTSSLTLQNSPTDGYVLTSDANGIGSWQPFTGGTDVSPVLLSGTIENSDYITNTLFRSSSVDYDGPSNAGSYTGSVVRLNAYYRILMVELNMTLANPGGGILGSSVTVDLSLLPDSPPNVAHVVAEIDYGNINMVTSGTVGLGSSQKAFGTVIETGTTFRIEYGQASFPVSPNLDGSKRKFIIHIIDIP